MCIGQKTQKQLTFDLMSESAASPSSSSATLPGPMAPPHLAPGRADYEQAFNGVNLITEKISGTL